MKTLTFIGGSGFVGKSFIDCLNENRLKKFNIKKINIIARNPYILKKDKNLNLKNIKLIKADISKMKSLPKSNLFIYGAETTKTISYNNKKQITIAHQSAINNFCKILKKEKYIKVLYLSSGAIYKKKYQLNRSKYKNLYSKLKIYSENKIRNLTKMGVSATIARCYTFVGPRLPLKAQFAVGNFIYDGFNKKIIKIKSQNKVIRSYMHSNDLVNWLITMLLKSNNKCKIYNVGSDKEIEIQKLAKLIGIIFNKPVSITNFKSKKVDKYVPNIVKTQQELGLKINNDLMKSILLTINYIDEKIN